MQFPVKILQKVYQDHDEYETPIKPQAEKTLINSQNLYPTLALVKPKGRY